MTGKGTSLFQKIANEKGWTFKQIGERWGVSERQMSRIANAGNQRDLDSVNGLPNVNRCMKYEQAVHDQALFAASEGLALSKRLAALFRKADGEERRNEAQKLEKRFSNHSSRCFTLGYMYEAVGRTDLQDMMQGLSILLMTDALTALQDPEGWAEACRLAGTTNDVSVSIPEKQLKEWRLDFLAALKN